MSPPRQPSKPAEWRRVALEALTVGLLALGVGLGANALSPRGLSLSRDYFPAGSQPTSAAPQRPLDPGGGTVAASSPTAVAEAGRQGASAALDPAAPPALPPAVASTRLQDKGLTALGTDEALALFQDPRYETELVVFVDARNERQYAEGHVPGAILFDRFYPERHLPHVLTAALSALEVVVYCGGGDCEDSEFAAVMLAEAGVPAEHLRVYTGGFNEWAARGLPIERGARHSGQVSQGTP